MLKKKHFIFILFFIVAELVSATVFPVRPSPARWVNNLSVEMPDFLSASEIDSLETKLSAFEKETSNQIVIVIVDDLGGLEPFDYATQLGRAWGVGQANADNGIVILIKPTGGEGQRNLFIAVGYGLEGAIPDLTTKQIRETEMYPYFKMGQYYIALDRATNVLMALAKGEYNASSYASSNNQRKSWFEKEYTVFGFTAPGFAFIILSVFALFLVFFLAIVVSAIYKGLKAARANWLLNKDKPKLTVKEFFTNPFNPNRKGYRYSWLLTLVLFLLVISQYGIIIIIATFIIAKIRKMPGSDSFRNAFSGGSSMSSSYSWSSHDSSSSWSSDSSSSSDFGGGDFGGGGSGGDW